MNKHNRWKVIMKKLSLSRGANKRLDWIIFYETKGQKNVSLTTRYFGIHRSTFYKWYKRFDEMNLRSLADRSKKPKKVRYRESEPIKDRRVIALRKDNMMYGKIKLKVLYKRYYKEEISAWYIQRVIEKYKLYPPKTIRKRKVRKSSKIKKKITEFEKKPKTGYLFHMDTIVLHLQNTKRYIITGIDAHSKIAYARMYKKHTSETARDFLKRLYFIMEEQIDNIHTDNGSEFHKNFEKELERLKIPHFWSRRHTPKDNPSNERFNRTLKEEFLRWGNFGTDPVEFNKNLTEWLVEYNAFRPHQSLNYLTPLSFAQKTFNLSTMYSSSTTC